MSAQPAWGRQQSVKKSRWKQERVRSTREEVTENGRFRLRSTVSELQRQVSFEGPPSTGKAF